MAAELGAGLGGGTHVGGWAPAASLSSQCREPGLGRRKEAHATTDLNVFKMKYLIPICCVLNGKQIQT